VHGSIFWRNTEGKLHAAAIALSKDELIASDLVDLLIGDLFGTSVSGDGSRRSKLALYTGRGTLESWLRAVLAQAYVDRYRSTRKYTSLTEETSALNRLCAAETPWEYTDPRLARAVEDALSELPAESRFLLKAVFLDSCTFAQVAAMLGVHESTVSRRAGKLTTKLRKRVLRILRQHGMSAAAAEEALETDVRRLSVDVRHHLLHDAQPLRD
jgi:RNA polymerase sigma-70 factor (ECF subfamily)